MFRWNSINILVAIPIEVFGHRKRLRFIKTQSVGILANPLNLIEHHWRHVLSAQHIADYQKWDVCCVVTWFWNWKEICHPFWIDMIADFPNQYILHGIHKQAINFLITSKHCLLLSLAQKLGLTCSPSRIHIAYQTLLFSIINKLILERERERGREREGER